MKTFGWQLYSKGDVIGVTGYTLFQLEKFREDALAIESENFKKLAMVIRNRNIEKPRDFERFLKQL